ncbi:hypothetical protein ROZALSC1DRAFT_25226 [Rozella allomycis CSF55]|uniref:Uncharacterized protein n=1 Tax=Rozella allomycis (strain CSF55) TaxID=988480 RepID=A0A4V1IZ15_ROZAC|nr:hypothetical protein ROZALSC1DRAFT_25226 [Rozella allomycis CSF55]
MSHYVSPNKILVYASLDTANVKLGFNLSFRTPVRWVVTLQHKLVTLDLEASHPTCQIFVLLHCFNGDVLTKGCEDPTKCSLYMQGDDPPNQGDILTLGCDESDDPTIGGIKDVIWEPTLLVVDMSPKHVERVIRGFGMLENVDQGSWANHLRDCMQSVITFKATHHTPKSKKVNN